jgi:hypothetical protein
MEDVKFKDQNEKIQFKTKNSKAIKLKIPNAFGLNNSELLM